MKIRVFAAVFAAALLFLAGRNADAQSATAISTYHAWNPMGRAALSVSNTSSNVALPSAGALNVVAEVCNTGAVDAYAALGTSSSVTATTAAGTWVKAGNCVEYPTNFSGTTYTYLAAITASSTTTLYIETGIGGVTLSPPSVAVTQSTSPWVISGNVGGFDFQLAPTVTVQNAAYSAGYSEGGIITVTGAARTNGGSGIIDAVRLKSTGGSTNTIWVYAWSHSPAATCTDKAAYVASTSDQPYAIPGFPVAVTLGGAPGSWDTATYAMLSNLVSNFKNQDSSPGTAVYLCLVTAGSVTPASTSDLSLIVGGVQD